MADELRALKKFCHGLLSWGRENSVSLLRRLPFSSESADPKTSPPPPPPRLSEIAILRGPDLSPVASGKEERKM